MTDHATNNDTETLAEVISDLRREIGPPTDRDRKWQPMVSAYEIRVLLDALDDLAARDADVAAQAKAEALAPVLALADQWEQAEADDSMWTVYNGTECAEMLRAAVAVPEPEEGQ